MGRYIKYESLLPEIKRIKENGFFFSVIGGVFDLLHPGHLEALNFAKDQAQILLVNVLNDRRVKITKSLEKNSRLLIPRPILPDVKRAKLVAALGMVDIVTIHPMIKESPTVHLVAIVQPNIYVVGTPLPPEEINFLRAKTPKTKIVIGPSISNPISTTKIIKRVVRLYLQKRSLV